ncbi:hypothetical protein A2761_03160 [Candidatus Kaiserbacteria bacterium RIFCSPHIGHO2_01_FULL_51_33]|nr:MAG: hypothetical protein A2761_03160 [Candidatus Kaiserbacteria bacterium RIFCSPHIGHO2_01_FULL_51_33]
MRRITSQSSLTDYQHFIEKVYGPSNRRHFTAPEMLTNIERYVMRSLKGIRKNDTDKIQLNVVIALNWFLSLLNLLEIDLEKAVWNRFPYLCSYCGTCPCSCKEKKVKKRKSLRISSALRPKTLHGFQEMFGRIYPASNRTLEHAGIHLAEEMGELSEAVLKFRGGLTKQDFYSIESEGADLFSCFMGVCNSIHVDLAKELAHLFPRGCHVCNKIPCVCEYSLVINFKS